MFGLIKSLSQSKEKQYIYDKIDQNQNLIRYMRELGLSSTADYLDVYRDLTPNLDDYSNQYSNLYGSYKNCKKHIERSQYDKNRDFNKPIKLDNNYIIEKSLGGGKSGALVFLVKNKEGKKCVLKLYIKRLITNIGDRDQREIFTACTLSNIMGFPQVFDYGIAEFDRESPFWENFIKEYEICVNQNRTINFNLYRSCFYLVLSFSDGDVLEKLDLIDVNVYEMVWILDRIRDMLFKANNLIPKFIHNDLHPGNIIINNLLKENNYITNEPTNKPTVSIIDFDIAISPEFKKDLSSLRSSSKNIIIQIALITMMCKYIGLKYAMYIMVNTANIANNYGEDFRMWYIYKIIFDCVIFYKLIKEKLNLKNEKMTIPLKVLDIVVKAAMMKHKDDMKMCTNFGQCSNLEYIKMVNSGLNNFEIDNKIKDYMTDYLSKSLADNMTIEKDIYNNVLKLMVNNYVTDTIKKLFGIVHKFNMDDYLIKNTPEKYQQIYDKSGDVMNVTQHKIPKNIRRTMAKYNINSNVITKKIDNFIYDNIVLELINKIMQVPDEMEKKFYEKTNRHLSIENVNISTVIKFDNYLFPIHGDDKTRYIKINSGKEKNDGIHITINAEKIILTFVNVEIISKDLSELAFKNNKLKYIPFASKIIDKIFSNTASNMKFIEYDIANQKLTLDDDSMSVLSNVVSSLSKNETVQDKITMVIRKLLCPSDVTIIDYIKNNFTKIIPSIIYFLKTYPQDIDISVQAIDGRDILYNKVIKHNLNYELVNGVVKILDNVFVTSLKNIGEKIPIVGSMLKKEVKYADQINSNHDQFIMENKYLDHFRNITNENISSIDNLIEYNKDNLVYNFDLKLADENDFILRFMKNNVIKKLNSLIVSGFNDQNPKQALLFYNNVKNMLNKNSLNDIINDYDKMTKNMQVNNFFVTYYNNRRYVTNNVIESYDSTFNKFIMLGDKNINNITIKWILEYFDKMNDNIIIFANKYDDIIVPNDSNNIIDIFKNYLYDSILNVNQIKNIKNIAHKIKENIYSGNDLDHVIKIYESIRNEYLITSSKMENYNTVMCAINLLKNSYSTPCDGLFYDFTNYYVEKYRYECDKNVFVPVINYMKLNIDPREYDKMLCEHYSKE